MRILVKEMRLYDLLFALLAFALFALGIKDVVGKSIWMVYTVLTVPEIPHAFLRRFFSSHYVPIQTRVHEDTKDMPSMIALAMAHVGPLWLHEYRRAVARGFTFSIVLSSSWRC